MLGTLPGRRSAPQPCSTRLHRGRAGLRELGLCPTTPTWSRASLNRPTSNRRRLATITAPLADIVAAARAGGTVNDVVLAAVTGALIGELHAGGERPFRLVVYMPVSGRRSTDRRPTRQLHRGPTDRRPHTRRRPRPARRDHLPHPGKPRTCTGLLSWPARSSVQSSQAARAVPAVITLQRLVHTLETNMRCPGAPMCFAGHQVVAVVPAAVDPGNIGASFDALSYAGTLTITAVVDPHIVPIWTGLRTPSTLSTHA